QPIAANVDQVLVVAAARDPEPNPRMLDRFLVIAEANRLPCVVILNKIELDRSALERLTRRYGVAGYQVLATSVNQPEGLTALLGVCFPEFRRFLDQCRFDNCRHLAEPGCAVREAAGAGTFDPDRLESYRHIYEEVSVPSWSSARRRAR